MSDTSETEYNPENIKSAEMVVCIPSYNEVDSISYPTIQADKGLKKYFGEKSAVIINCDNNSPDNTRQAFLDTPTDAPKIYISTAPGVKGKGNNFGNLFRKVVDLAAQAVVVVDADLKRITPEWIKHLGEPLYSGFSYVAPLYIRHKYDGTITNGIAYPMTRALYGRRVRQPIGGDFGFSGELATAYAKGEGWSEAIANFGIDIWMTTIAIARRFKVCQTFLGAPKTHRTKDPAKDLGPMLTQVVMTFFDLIIDFEYLWKDTAESQPSSIFGFGLGIEEKPPEVIVDTEALYQSFISGLDKYENIWEKIVTKPVLIEARKAKKVPKEKFFYHTDLWAKILFNFVIAYRNNEIPRKKIIEALIPFYHSRILSFINRTGHLGTKECEEYCEMIVRIFEKEKYYLIERWDEDQKKLGHKLFKK